MEEIHEEIKEAIKGLETYKKRYRTMDTQDVIDILKRLNENVKLTIPVVSKAFYCLEGGIKGSEHVCKKQCDSCNRFQQ